LSVTELSDRDIYSEVEYSLAELPDWEASDEAVAFCSLTSESSPDAVLVGFANTGADTPRAKAMAVAGKICLRALLRVAFRMDLSSSVMGP